MIIDLFVNQEGYIAGSIWGCSKWSILNNWKSLISGHKYLKPLLLSSWILNQIDITDFPLI